jgi:uncharacterized glyoxalase superfamily protein PhnB
MKNINNNLIIELHIPDFKPAREFYSLFDFTESYYHPQSGGGSDLGYMVLTKKDKAGDTMLNFYGDKPKVAGHARFADFPKDTPRGYGTEITIVVDDVEVLWKQVKDKLNKDQISQELTMKRWGKQDFRVIDPFGFYIRFTELVNWGQ